jgi:hypothetical protein
VAALLSAARAAIELFAADEAHALLGTAAASGIEDEVLALELATLRADVLVSHSFEDAQAAPEGFRLAEEAGRRARRWRRAPAVSRTSTGAPCSRTSRRSES